MSFFKDKPVRSRKYLDWVKEQPCSICGAPSDDPHHLIAMKRSGMGTKECDLLTMPVCRPHHTEIHENPEYWALQWKYIALTLQKAAKEGVLNLNNNTN